METDKQIMDAILLQLKIMKSNQRKMKQMIKKHLESKEETIKIDGSKYIEQINRKLLND